MAYAPPKIVMSDTADCLAQHCLVLLAKLPQQTVMLIDPIGQHKITVVDVVVRTRALRAHVVTGTLYDSTGRCLTSDVLTIRPLRATDKQKPSKAPRKNNDG